jgi:putative transposase
MQRLKLRHAVRFNRRNNSSGYVFERRYWSEVMEDERHLCEVARYIVLNPLRAHLCSHPGLWNWSSYNGTIGRSRDKYDYSRLLREFGGDLVAYTAFVAELVTR